MSYIVLLVINKNGGEMSYYYYHVSVLVLFLAIINLTNIAGNPKYQIHAQTEGPFIYQQPTTDTQRPKHKKLPQFPRFLPPPPPPTFKPPTIHVPGVQHLPPRRPVHIPGVQHFQPRRPIRPPPMNIPAV